MTDKLEISVPSDLSDISLEQYKEWIKIVEATKDDDSKSDFLDRALIEIFCNVSISDIAKIKATEFYKILDILSDTFNNECNELVRTFSMDGIEYGFEPNIEEIQTGAYIDVEASMVDWNNVEVAMAALYRPIIGKRKTRNVEQYEIEEYKPSDIKSQAMLNAPLDAVLSARVFFCNLAKELSAITLVYLEQEMKKEQDTQQRTILEQSGDGISQFIRLQEEMHSNLMKLPLCHYTKR